MSETHSEPTDHEHLPDDGCKTVEHDGHVDHLHDGDQHREAEIHADHGAPHVADDACEKVEHDGHIDHVHDGHLHFQHGDHVHEH